MSQTENMALWGRVCQTDPRHTKKVSFGRSFTSIDAHYQVMMATREFGPLGQGWTYECEFGFQTLPPVNSAGKEHEARTQTLIWCDLTIRWGRIPDDGSDVLGRIFSNSFGPIRCMCPMTDNKGAADKDAGKKAMTDALTKGLSHLGFNADVFLGKFDDNAYVQQMRQKFQDEKPPEIVDYERATQEATSLDRLREINTTFSQKMLELRASFPEQVTAAAALWTLRKAELSAKAAEAVSEEAAQ